MKSTTTNHVSYSPQTFVNELDISWLVTQAQQAIAVDAVDEFVSNEIQVTKPTKENKSICDITLEQLQNFVNHMNIQRRPSKQQLETSKSGSYKANKVWFCVTKSFTIHIHSKICVPFVLFGISSYRK